MEPFKYAVWAVMLCLLAGCATTFRPWNLSEVETGMDRAQVIRILGEPDFIESDSEEEVLHYTYMENYNPPLADDSTPANTTGHRLWEDQIKRGFREYRYAIRLVDGKVLGYKELTD